MATDWEYRLSAELSAHSLDVRATAVGPEGCVLSASRDTTARLWHPQGIRDFTNVQTYKGHNDFVASICFIGPCKSYPEGLVVTGSNDKKICCYIIHESLPVLTLKGHENTVCSVIPGNEPGTILSASWDSTGRLWSVDKSESILNLKGHLAVVWSIIQLENGNIITGSADKTLIIWNKEGNKVKTLSGHTDCVRGLSVANKEMFLSVANDATIRLWTYSGECLNTFYGHSNYIYSVCINPFLASGSQCFVTCGEDSTIRVWSNGDNVCTIMLPAQSVWNVCCLPNGDIVSGSSDGIVRVFTKDATRQADESILKYYEDSVKKYHEASTQEIGGYKVSDLPGPEVLLDPGKSDGQTKLVRSGDKVKCYSWSSSTQSWSEIGEVLGSTKPAEGKSVYQGKEYDFVFSVDIEDGKPPLKLPYNKDEDPWVAAQTFIHKNLLPQAYLEQVANFIVKNAKVEGTLPANSDFMDPFTGETRYMPGSNPTAGQTNGSNANADPFTGASSYTTGSQTKYNPTSNYFPYTSYLRFDQANTSAILDKLIEFNDRVQDVTCKVSEEDLRSIIKFSDQSFSDTKAISTLKIVLEWPKELLFPVLDVLRLAVRNQIVNENFFKNQTYEIILMKILLDNLLLDSPMANQLCSMRALTNAFTHNYGEKSIVDNHEIFLNTVICLQNLNKNMQIAVATLMLNLSVALGPSNPTFLCQTLLEIFIKLVDNEAQFRALMALGTLMVTTTSKPTIVSMIVSNDIFMNKLKSLSGLSGASDPNKQKVIKCAKQIILLL